MEIKAMFWQQTFFFSIYRFYPDGFLKFWTAKKKKKTFKWIFKSDSNHIWRWFEMQLK